MVRQASMTEAHGVRRRRVVVATLVGLAVWQTAATLSATQQWAQLLGTAKAAGWFAAYLYQAPSWTTLALLTPVVVLAIERWPLGEGRAHARLLTHIGVSLAFGAVFLGVSVPVRHLFHPAPVSWQIFGAPFYKSGPQWFVLGVGAYWMVAMGATLVDVRARLARVQGGEAAPRSASIRTPVGEAIVDLASVRWVQPRAGGGSVIHTDSGPIRAAMNLVEVAAALGPDGFVRVHRSRVVSIRRVVEVVGSPHRDGWVTLDTDERVPVARRRMPELRRALELRAVDA